MSMLYSRLIPHWRTLLGQIPSPVREEAVVASKPVKWQFSNDDDYIAKTNDRPNTSPKPREDSIA